MITRLELQETVNMLKEDYEGSIVLEILAEHDLLDEFYDAIDSDDISEAISLMRKAHIDEENIKMTIKMALE